MIIDCESCTVRDLACADCVVPLMSFSPPGPVFLDDESFAALTALADGGLVPPLLMTPERERDAS